MVLVRMLNRTPMTRQEKAEEMLAHVAAVEQSGTSRKTYCEQHGLKLCVLNYWFCKRKRCALEVRKGFSEVHVSVGANVELQYPNGVRLLLPPNTAMEHVAACIRLY